MKIVSAIANLLGIARQRTTLAFVNEVENSEFDPDAILDISAAFPRYENYHWFEAPNEIDRLLAKIRHAESRINQATETMLQLDHLAPNSLIAQAVVDSALTKYMSCFQTGEFAPQLDYKKVFARHPDLQRKHKILKAIRDNYLNHPSKARLDVKTLIITNDLGETVDTPTVFLKHNIYNSENLNGFWELLIATKDFIDTELPIRMAKAYSLAQNLKVEDLGEPIDDYGISFFVDHD